MTLFRARRLSSAAGLVAISPRCCVGFDVSDDDPIVVLDLVPLIPQSVEKALERSRTSTV